MLNRTVLAALLAAALASVLGCRSEGKQEVAAVGFPCTCGEPEAAIEGCLHPDCVSGEGNPDNPDCACAPFTIGGER